MENVIKKQASRRKYHYIYKTTCIITERFYIGMHSTDNLEDGYVGSGKRLWHSINKHGKENHRTEILEFLIDRKSLVEREKEIVNQEMINEELCMNLKLGGDGGCTREVQNTRSSAGGKAAVDILTELRKNPEWATNVRNNISKGIRNAISEGRFFPRSFKGKTHTEETIANMRESRKGTGVGVNNSQYGKCWITNGIDSIKINKGDSIPEGWKLGRKIKTTKLGE